MPMLFGTIIRHPVTRAVVTSARTFGLASLLMMHRSPSPLTQRSSDARPAEMLVTEQGFLAIDSPKDWVRTAGPGLAYFVPPIKDNEQAPVWIYISSAPVGQNEEAKDLQAYIQSDIGGFKARFKNCRVREEAPLILPDIKLRAPVYTFESGEKRNAVEQVVYVGENNRVLTLVLSSQDKASFLKALPVFRNFAKSYRGSITPSPVPN